MELGAVGDGLVAGELRQRVEVVVGSLEGDQRAHRRGTVGRGGERREQRRALDVPALRQRPLRGVAQPRVGDRLRLLAPVRELAPDLGKHQGQVARNSDGEDVGELEPLRAGGAGVDEGGESFARRLACDAAVAGLNRGAHRPSGLVAADRAGDGGLRGGLGAVLEREVRGEREATARAVFWDGHAARVERDADGRVRACSR